MNVNPSAAWVWSEVRGGSSEVETASVGPPQARPLSTFFLPLYPVVADCSDITFLQEARV